jgi:hypothetical protein
MDKKLIVLATTIHRAGVAKCKQTLHFQKMDVLYGFHFFVLELINSTNLIGQM